MGMFAEGNFGRKFNASDYNITVPFGALVEKGRYLIKSNSIELTTSLYVWSSVLVSHC